MERNSKTEPIRILNLHYLKLLKRHLTSKGIDDLYDKFQIALNSMSEVSKVVEQIMKKLHMISRMKSIQNQDEVENFEPPAKKRKLWTIN